MTKGKLPLPYWVASKALMVAAPSIKTLSDNCTEQGQPDLLTHQRTKANAIISAIF